MGSQNKNPIGAPFGRKTSWGGAEDRGDGVGEMEGGGGARGSADGGRRSAWDDRAGIGDGGGSRRTTQWDDRAPEQSSSASGGGTRRSMWDERGADGQRRDPGPEQSRSVPSRFDQRQPSGGCCGGGCGGGCGGCGGCGGHGGSSWGGCGACGDGGGSCAGGGTATLLVGNLSLQAREADVAKVFQQANVEIEALHIPLDRETGNSKGIALVEIQLPAREDPEIATDNAIHRLHGVEIHGRPITVDLKGSQVSPQGDGGRGSMGCMGGMGSDMGRGGNMGKGVGGMAGRGGAIGGRGVGDMGGPIGGQMGSFPDMTMGKGGACGGGCGGAHLSAGVSLSSRPPSFGVPSLRKTQICQYFIQNRCTRGSLCSFAHGEHELGTVGGAARPPSGGGLSEPPPPVPTSTFGKTGPIGMSPSPVPPVGMGMGMGLGPGVPPGLGKGPLTRPTNRKTQMCVYFKEGRCTRGIQCSYAHHEDELWKGGPGLGGVGPKGRFEARGNARRSRSRSRGAARPLRFTQGDLHAPLERLECLVEGPPRPRKSRATLRADAAEAAEAADAAVAAEAARTEEAARAVNGQEPADGNVEAKKEGVDSEGATKDATEVEQGADKKACDAKASKASASAACSAPAVFLLNEDGAAQLDETYGLGARLLRAMGWKAGTGIGKDLDGELEPVSVRLLNLSSTHYGRKDRRCVGRRPPRRFLDSDESSPSRSLSSSSARSSSRSRKSSSSSSHRKKQKTKRRKKLKKKSRSRSSSRSSRSSSSSSSSSRSKRKRKSRSRKLRKTPPKDGGSKFTGGGPPNSSAAGAAAAAAVLQQQAKPTDPPEIAQAKKQVLAKLTVLKNVEPKEQRAKEFRNLLRDWHPDKNPDKLEMATAVFQFLQKGKSLLNLK